MTNNPNYEHIWDKNSSTTSESLELVTESPPRITDRKEDLFRIKAIVLMRVILSL